MKEKVMRLYLGPRSVGEGAGLVMHLGVVEAGARNRMVKTRPRHCHLELPPKRACPPAQWQYGESGQKQLSHYEKEFSWGGGRALAWLSLSSPLCCLGGEKDLLLFVMILKEAGQFWPTARSHPLKRLSVARCPGGVWHGVSSRSAVPLSLTALFIPGI